MRTTEQKALQTFLAEQILPKMRVNFQAPKDVRTDQDQQHWFVGLYMAVVGITTDTKLVYQAWLHVTRTFKGRTWPQYAVLCDAIKELAPDLDVGSKQKSKRPDGKNSREMGDYVRANHARVLAEWWDYYGDAQEIWPEGPPGPERMVVELVADEKKAADIRRTYRRLVESAAHFHTQRLYWGTTNSPLDFAEKGYEWWRDQLSKEVQALRARCGGGMPSRQLPAPGYAKLASELMANRAAPAEEPPPG